MELNCGRRAEIPAVEIFRNDSLFSTCRVSNRTRTYVTSRRNNKASVNEKKKKK